MLISDKLRHERDKAMPSFLKSIGVQENNDKDKWQHFIVACKSIEPDLIPYCKVAMPESFKNVEGHRYQHCFCADIDCHMMIYFLIGVDYTREHSVFSLADSVRGFTYRLQYDAPTFGYYAVPNVGKEMGYYKNIGDALAAASYYYKINNQ